MRIYTPIIILGLLVFIIPFLNFPPKIEGIVISILGFLIFLIVSFAKILEIEERPKENYQESLFSDTRNEHN